jgi:hypothetical protein
MAAPHPVSRRYKPPLPDQQAVEIAEAGRHLDQLTTDVAPSIRQPSVSGPTPPQRRRSCSEMTPNGINSEPAFAKLCSACHAGKLRHDRLEDNMVNRLIFFDTPQTTADQRRTPKATQMAPRRAGASPQRPWRTPISLCRARTAITMTMAMPTAPATKAMPPKTQLGGPPVTLSARRRS